MFKNWRKETLIKKIFIAEKKVDLLMVAEKDYGRAYYTDKLIEETLKLEALKFKLGRLEDKNDKTNTG